MAISAQGGELSSAGGCQLLHPWSLAGEGQREIIFGYMGPLWHTTRTTTLIRRYKTATLLNHTASDVTSREINDAFAPHPRLTAQSGHPNPRRCHCGSRNIAADRRYKDIHHGLSCLLAVRSRCLCSPAHPSVPCPFHKALTFFYTDKMRSATFVTAAAMAVMPFAAAGLISTRASAATCRCLPGDACWPATSSWDSLNSTVGGKLIATVPIGSVCHDPTYDEAACTALRDSWVLPQTQ